MIEAVGNEGYQFEVPLHAINIIILMKFGFLLNIMLLLCFVCSQLLIWLIDGTLVMTLAELLNMQSSVFTQQSSWWRQPDC